MEAYSLFSGSTGNCIFLRDENTRILVDAGGSMKQLEGSLNALGESLSALDGIFITHEHSDHTKALPVLAKHLSIPIYCQSKVAKEMYLSLMQREKRAEGSALARWIRTVEVGMEYEVGSLVITPFKTPHDSVDSQGFIIGDQILGIATDLGHVSPEVERFLLGCQSVILESNHDLTMLREGPYPPYLKERVASEIGHLNNEDCAAFSQRLYRSGCRNLTLFHLSQDNNTTEIALGTTKHALAQIGAENVRLCAAEPYDTVRVL